MFPSYEAIYDHGRLNWIGDAPGPVRARVIVTLIAEQDTNNVPEAAQDVPNETRIAAFLTEMAEQGIGKVFGDSLEWQGETREDRVFPGREDLPKNLSRKPLNEEEIERIMQKSCGAWGNRTLAESDALIRQRRLEDWGEDIP